MFEVTLYTNMNPSNDEDFSANTLDGLISRVEKFLRHPKTFLGGVSFGDFEYVIDLNETCEQGETDVWSISQYVPYTCTCYNNPSFEDDGEPEDTCPCSIGGVCEDLIQSFLYSGNFDYIVKSFLELIRKSFGSANNG